MAQTFSPDSLESGERRSACGTCPVAMSTALAKPMRRSKTDRVAFGRMSVWLLPARIAIRGECFGLSWVRGFIHPGPGMPNASIRRPSADGLTVQPARRPFPWFHSGTRLADAFSADPILCAFLLPACPSFRLPSFTV
jgi:hypothetical protein